MELAVNGTRLYYEKTGQGPAIILLHCNFASHKIFDVLTRQLQQNYTVYAVDSRGHGKSQKHKRYDYFEMMEDIAAFIRALCIEKPIIYGYSDGGILGLLLAGTYPDMLSKLIASGANMDQSGQTKGALRTVKFGYFITRDRRLRLILDQPDLPFALLKNITVPTLITAGEHDMITLAHTQKIAAHIPGSQLLIIPGEKHGSYISHSKKLYPLIKEFLQTP